ncbi:putative cytosolic phospholipase A2 [Aulographum hederae CBS 113979]|uniref:Lysophospholipase n=1 Tax=Aulographum hederae CBS 113979 TaxID=1176131 RepID=A0A6G1HGP7_9PEZI|nr:putative cytosolic phospholipase A2 [Aulographum hederae CBS 113979]
MRRSETFEQHEYEQQMYGQQEDPGSLKVDQPDVRTSFGDKMKGVFKKIANHDAMADLRMMKSIASVEHLVTKDLRNAEMFPEVATVAEVRHGLDLCLEEKEYLSIRREHVRNHFASYIGVDPAEVHPDDIPIISFGGSGGGFRAMIGMMAYSDHMKKSGLGDVLTYVAGVSGSCWTLAAYYTFGDASWESVIRQCKRRFHPNHPLSMDAIRQVLSAPEGPLVALGPIVQKHQSGLETVAMDLYSVFTTGHVFLHNDPMQQPGGTVSKEVAGYHREWFKWSNATKYLNQGQEPLPILTAIRHERPWKDWADSSHPFKDANPNEKEHSEAEDAWFQWYEMTPFEIGCDELEAWVPTWAFGRPFSEGRSTMQLPEQSLALLLGLCTSAPAGPLTSYLATIKRNLPGGFIGDSITNMASSISKYWGKQGTEEFQQHHPLHACNEHNFLFHATPLQPGERRPDGIENSPRIHLIDSGMDNNCPTYPLLHPRRHVDLILTMDASSDVLKDSFQQRVDQIGARRGLKFTRRHDLKPRSEDPKDPDRFNDLYAQIYDGELIERPPTVIDSYGHEVKNPPAPTCETVASMVYMPLLPNERAVPDFDPSTAKFSGSYNLVWTEEQVDMLVRVCEGNSQQGMETVKLAVREAWQRKTRAREARERI